jgi:hypothetical protein
MNPENTNGIRKRRTLPEAAKPYRWKKGGPSPNPGGRPKKDLASIIAREVFTENPEAIKAGLARALQRGDGAVFKSLADRAFGRLPQPLQVSGEPEHPVQIVFAMKRPDWLPAPPALTQSPETASAPAPQIADVSTAGSEESPATRAARGAAPRRAAAAGQGEG